MAKNFEKIHKIYKNTSTQATNFRELVLRESTNRNMFAHFRFRNSKIRNTPNTCRLVADKPTNCVKKFSKGGRSHSMATSAEPNIYQNYLKSESAQIQIPIEMKRNQAIFDWWRTIQREKHMPISSEKVCRPKRMKGDTDRIKKRLCSGWGLKRIMHYELRQPNSSTI